MPESTVRIRISHLPLGPTTRLKSDIRLDLWSVSGRPPCTQLAAFIVCLAETRILAASSASHENAMRSCERNPCPERRYLAGWYPTSREHYIIVGPRPELADVPHHICSEALLQQSARQTMQSVNFSSGSHTSLNITLDIAHIDIVCGSSTVTQVGAWLAFVSCLIISGSTIILAIIRRPSSLTADYNHWSHNDKQCLKRAPDATPTCDEERHIADFDLHEGTCHFDPQESTSFQHSNRDPPPAEPGGVWLSWFLGATTKALVAATCGAFGGQSPSSPEIGDNAV